MSANGRRPTASTGRRSVRDPAAHLEAWIKIERRLFLGTACVALALAAYWWFLDPIRRAVLERAQVDNAYNGAATIFIIEPITAVALSVGAVWRAQQVQRLRQHLPGINPRTQQWLAGFFVVIAVLSISSGLLFRMNTFFFLALLFFGVAGRSVWRVGQLTKLKDTA
jgi:hypothetical protein